MKEVNDPRQSRIFPNDSQLCMISGLAENCVMLFRGCSDECTRRNNQELANWKELFEGYLFLFQAVGMDAKHPMVKKVGDALAELLILRARL
jgi:hypothetical protein